MAAATAAVTATQLLLHSRLFRPLRHPKLIVSPSSSLSVSFSLFPTRLRPLSSSTTYAAVSETLNLSEVHRKDDETEELPGNEKGREINGDGSNEVVKMERKVPNLTVSEKKQLGSYANSLGDKLKCQQVGKSGVTDNVVFALSETLESKELLKLKIHKTCPGELDDVVKQLEKALGSVVVGQIGRTVIFYRPSLTKQKVEEKKEQARRLFALKKQKAQAAFMMRKREQLPRRPGRDYHGSRTSDKFPS